MGVREVVMQFIAGWQLRLECRCEVQVGVLCTTSILSGSVENLILILCDYVILVYIV